MNQSIKSSSSVVMKVCRRYLVVGVFALVFILLVFMQEKRTLTCASDTLSEPQNNYSFSKIGARLELPYERGRFDNQRIIRIYDFIRVGKEWKEIMGTYDICLTTQTSIERLYWVPQVLETWKGPVSLALLVVTEMEWLAFNIYSIFLERCYPSFRDHVTIHLAVPSHTDSFMFDEEKLRQWNFDNLTREAYERDCGDQASGEIYLNELLKALSIPTASEKDAVAMKIVYPQNHLRNIAKNGCETPWIFSTDVDIIPRYGMAYMLQEFYEFNKKENCTKCAYVIPTFELLESKPFPETKADIIKYFMEDTARQYHGKDFSLAQHATNYLKWVRTSIEEGPTRVSHKVLDDFKSMKDYEPFYISSGEMPAFDERFVGYGGTRSSQFQEAHLSGWKFSVLSNVFSIHWGLHSKHKRKENLTLGDSIRKKQSTNNRQLLNKILEEMKFKKSLSLFN